MITRRELAMDAGAIAVFTALGAHFSAPARGQSALMVPPALGEMSLGNPSAAVTVIEYASLWCSGCGNFYRTVYPELKKRYIDTGKIHFIYRDFPLNDRGMVGSMLAHCAGRQGGRDKYFAVVDMLFERQNSWAYVKEPRQPLLQLAKQAGFSEQSFSTCLADQKLLDALEAEQTRAKTTFGVASTPTFFINGTRLQGAPTIEAFAKLIDPLLKS